MKTERFRAAIREGALALSLGWDPIRYLDLEGVDSLVAAEVLQKALEDKAESDKQYWKNMVSVVQSGIARALGR